MTILVPHRGLAHSLNATEIHLLITSLVDVVLLMDGHTRKSSMLFVAACSWTPPSRPCRPAAGA